LLDVLVTYADISWPLSRKKIFWSSNIKRLKKCFSAKCQWLTPVILATWEAKIASQFEASLGK
jgi:hypothetical protein